MLLTERPSRAMDAAKSTGFGNFRIDFSRYSYSAAPEFIVAIWPMNGTTLVMNIFATFDKSFSPSGKENSRMQTRLVSFALSTRFISRKALALSGTFRIPNDIEILSIEASATPEVGSLRVPAASIALTLVKSCASPLTSLTTPSKPLVSTLLTPLRSISELGSIPSTAGVPSEEAWAPRALNWSAARRDTSAVPVAKSSTRSPCSKRIHCSTSVFRQYWSNPKDIHLLVESYTKAILSNMPPEPKPSGTAVPNSALGDDAAPELSAASAASSGAAPAAPRAESVASSSSKTTGVSKKTAMITESGTMPKATAILQPILQQPPRRPMANTMSLRTRALGKPLDNGGPLAHKRV
mmetsp:Transcript_69434/g.175025  ORF Transcript_69434/g.175025 Transcript_69434/m.175025 type:complete len:353 (-) Transcript_69434:35-1093(-)